MIFNRTFDRRFLKFLLAGVINTIVGSVIMFALYNIAHINYIGQRLVVFRENKK